MNNLDPGVAERPEDLIVYGGSGKPVGTFQTHPGAQGLNRVSGTRRRLNACGEGIKVQCVSALFGDVAAESFGHDNPPGV